MGSTFDVAFPAVDQTTISNLSGGSGSVNTDSIMNSINTSENSNFIQSLNNAESTSNTSMTYGVLLNRNKTIRDIATDMTDQNKRVFNGAKDTFARQGEINEWQAQNKLDTLFFLQLTFLLFSVTVILLFLRQYGILPSATMYILLGFGLLVVIGVLWNRASYTSLSRDKRFWNRRFLGLTDAGGLTAQMQCAIKTTSS